MVMYNFEEKMRGGGSDAYAGKCIFNLVSYLFPSSVWFVFLTSSAENHLSAKPTLNCSKLKYKSQSCWYVYDAVIVILTLALQFKRKQCLNL